MGKQHFVIYLNPSRPDFAQTMTDEERSIIQQHVEYWTGIYETRNYASVCTCYGP